MSLRFYGFGNFVKMCLHGMGITAQHNEHNQTVRDQGRSPLLKNAWQRT